MSFELQVQTLLQGVFLGTELLTILNGERLVVRENLEPADFQLSGRLVLLEGHGLPTCLDLRSLAFLHR